jgi:hypothetical protein
VKVFQIDDHADQLKVYRSDTHTYLFPLSKALQPYLNQPTPQPPLIAAFQAADYSLSSQASITPHNYWRIANPYGTQMLNRPRDDGTDGVISPAFYENIQLVQQVESLHVYGAVLVRLTNVPRYPHEIAFGATVGLEAAINATVICPNGYPASDLPRSFTWEQLMTCARLMPLRN